MQEIFGLTDHIRRVADRFAAGFDALSPNLFTREGEPPSMEAGMDKLKAFVGRTPDAQILGDLNAAAAFLRGAGQARGTIGIVGYCWGGRFAMLAAAELEALDAAVAYYGRITGEATINQPRHPLGLAARMRAPLQGHFGGKDASIALDDVRRLEQDVR